MNEVVDGLLVHEGERGFRHYVGDYDDWLRQRHGRSRTRRATAASTPAPPRAKPAAPGLTPAEQRELKRLPQDIEKIEARIAALHQQMAAPTSTSSPSTFSAPPNSSWPSRKPRSNRPSALA